MQWKLSEKPTEHKKLDFPVQVLALDAWNRQKKECWQMPQLSEQVILLWIRNGSGSVEIDLKEYQPEDNTLYCILPGQLHRMKVSDSAAGYIITCPEQWVMEIRFGSDMLSRFDLYRMILQSPGIRMGKDSADAIEVVIRQMHDGSHKASMTLFKNACMILFKHLAWELKAAAQISLYSRKVRLVRNFMALIEKHYMRWKLVKNYARKLSVSPSHLNETVKELSGSCAGHHIRQRIVLEARRKAVHSGYSLKQIAYSLGFRDVGHFSRFFKVVYGKKFRDFKKEVMLSA